MSLQEQRLRTTEAESLLICALVHIIVQQAALADLPANNNQASSPTCHRIRSHSQIRNAIHVSSDLPFLPLSSRCLRSVKRTDRTLSVSVAKQMQLDKRSGF